jgi:hypothetical protein
LHWRTSSVDPTSAACTGGADASTNASMIAAHFSMRCSFDHDHGQLSLAIELGADAPLDSHTPTRVTMAQERAFVVYQERNS